MGIQRSLLRIVWLPERERARGRPGSCRGVQRSRHHHPPHGCRRNLGFIRARQRSGARGKHPGQQMPRQIVSASSRPRTKCLQSYGGFRYLQVHRVEGLVLLMRVGIRVSGGARPRPASADLFSVGHFRLRPNRGEHRNALVTRWDSRGSPSQRLEVGAERPPGERLAGQDR